MAHGMPHTWLKLPQQHPTQVNIQAPPPPSQNTVMELAR